MNKIFIYTIGVAILITGIFMVYTYRNKTEISTDSYRNIEYVIEGKKTSISDNNISNTRYFGDGLKTDLNNDGREDVVFIVTQETGGSGVFFYVVSAINTDSGYVGSDGFFLGDRISPQNITESQNPIHKNVIVVNYAVRDKGEPMTTQPSIGKSTYLKLDPVNMQWGIVNTDPL